MMLAKLTHHLCSPGFDVCYVNLPQRSMNDAQDTAEYVAYNIQDLAQKSATGKVYVVSWSQGSLNVQWALLYWPSLRDKVSGFGSLAGDFFGKPHPTQRQRSSPINPVLPYHPGVDRGPLLCGAQSLLDGGCAPSILQQSVGSKFLDALHKRGATALVNTLSLWSIQDQIATPAIIDPTAALPGSSAYTMQDLCGPLIVDFHTTMIVAAPSFWFIADTAAHGGVPDRNRFKKEWCSWLTDGYVDPDPWQPVTNTIAWIYGLLQNGLTTIANVVKTRKEPNLKAYVCAAGDADGYCLQS